MPLAIDERWEYHEPDPEVAELFAMTGACDARARIVDARVEDREGNVGFRFGRGDPNRVPALKLARTSLSARYREATVVRRQNVTCAECGDEFAPDRDGRRRCAGCRRLGRLRVLEDRPCPTCGVPFRPPQSRSKYCSRTCTPPTRRRVKVPSGFVAAWTFGVTGAEIARAFGVSRSTVRKWRSVSGLPSRRGGRPRKRGDRECRCGRRFYPRRGVERYCSRRCGRVYVERSLRGGIPVADDVRARALEMYREGASREEIMDFAGVSDTTVKRWRKAAGVPPRTCNSRR